MIWGVIPTMDQVASDSQMKANGVFAELDHPQHGRIQTVSSPLNVQGATKERPKPAPAVGEHSHEILRSLGYEEEALKEMIQRGVTI